MGPNRSLIIIPWVDSVLMSTSSQNTNSFTGITTTNGYYNENIVLF